CVVSSSDQPAGPQASVLPILARSAQPTDPDGSQPLPPPTPACATGTEGPLTLEQLLHLAAEYNPDLAIARARADAARGRLVQAGLYPNPTLNWEGDEIGIRGKAAGTQGPFVVQQIVTAHKLKIATAAAAAGVLAADWLAITRWYDVITRVRLAYFE